MAEGIEEMRRSGPKYIYVFRSAESGGTILFAARKISIDVHRTSRATRCVLGTYTRGQRKGICKSLGPKDSPKEFCCEVLIAVECQAVYLGADGRSLMS